MMKRLLSWVLNAGLDHLRLQDGDILVISGSNSREVGERLVRYQRYSQRVTVICLSSATTSIQVLDDKALAGVGLMRVPKPKDGEYDPTKTCNTCHDRVSHDTCLDCGVDWPLKHWHRG